MKKPLIITIILVVLIQGFFLLGSLFLGIGNLLASTGDTANARSWYEMASRYSPLAHQRSLGLYNLSRLSYLEKKYEESLKNLDSFTPTNSEESFSRGHNLGNAYYYLGEDTKDADKQISLWEKSVEAFSGALAIDNNPETRANYEYVLDKLKKLRQEKQKQEQKNEPQSGSGSESEKQTGSGGQSNQEKTQSGSTGEQKTGSGDTARTWKNAGEYNNVGTGSTADKLTEDQKKELDQYLKDMQAQSKELQQFYRQGKPAQNTENGINNMIQNFFGNDPFFQNQDSGAGKKDW